MTLLLNGCLWRSLVLMFGLLAGPAYAKTSEVVVTIKPLQLIAQEIASDDIRITTLLPLTASPHQYPLKASDYRLLSRADAVVWVGPELESFLAKAVSRREGVSLSLYALEGLSWPVIDQDEHDHSHNHTSGHAGKDPHIWLDPENAVVIANAMAELFSQLSPHQSELIRARANDFTDRMKSLTRDLDSTLQPVSSKGFAVYHEGFAHFVSRFQLHQLGYITLTPEQRSGAKHLAVLEELVKQEGVCVFQEPYADIKQVTRLADKYRLGVGTLDALGINDVENYSDLIANMASDLLTCLSEQKR